jgi:hypothetical protein
LAKKYVWELLDMLTEELKLDSYSMQPNISSVFWRNTLTASLVFEELLVYCEVLPEDSEETFLPRWLDEAIAFTSIADMRVLDHYFELLSPIWSVALFDGESLNLQEHTQLVKIITENSGSGKERFRTDLQLLLYEPGLELKQRGPCIRSVLVLACLALRQSGVYYDSWLNTIQRIMKFVLLLSETNRKHLSNFGQRVLVSCL